MKVENIGAEDGSDTNTILLDPMDFLRGFSVLKVSQRHALQTYLYPHHYLSALVLIECTSIHLLRIYRVIMVLYRCVCAKRHCMPYLCPYKSLLDILKQHRRALKVASIVDRVCHAPARTVSYNKEHACCICSSIVRCCAERYSAISTCYTSLSFTVG